MKIPKLGRRGRQQKVVVENVRLDNGEDEEEDIMTCTFDDDADPSIERCWETAEGGYTTATLKINTTLSALTEADGIGHEHNLALAGATMTLLVITGVMMLFRKQVQKSHSSAAVDNVEDIVEAGGGAETASASEQETAIAPGKSLEKEQPAGKSCASETLTSEAESRVKELKLCLEREAKEKQGLSEQNSFLKSALEERKATVQMFTSELQSRDEQLANFEQEQVKVKNELYKQIEALKQELQVQEKLQQENLNSMDGQCADLAGKVEGLMKELASREEQWERFEQDAKAKEVDSAAQIESMQQDFANRAQAQTVSLTAKTKECTELSQKLETLEHERKAQEEQLSKFQSQKQQWADATAEMKRLLKEKKEEILSLNTRMELFAGELQSRQDRLAALESKLQTKRELTESDSSNFRKMIKAQQDEHAMWKTKTEDIQTLLKVREEEAQSLAATLEGLTKELRSSEEKAASLESTIRDREFIITSKQDTVRKALQDEQDRRTHWEEQHTAMSRLLKARQEECASLTARVEIFAGELKSRATIVANLQSKVHDKENLVATQLETLKRELDHKKEFRDTWSESTKDINTMLEEKREQCIGLSTRADLFRLELEKRESRVASLENVLKLKEDAGAAALAPFQSQVKKHQDDLDLWTDKTNEVRLLLADRKQECVGLTTRLHLFKQKMVEYEETVGTMTKKINKEVGAHNTDMLPLREALQKQQQDRDKWTQQTMDLGNMLDNRQKQCVGLTTRLALFKQQAEYHQQQVNLLEVKAKEVQDMVDHHIIPLRDEVRVQREGLEAWKESTLNVEHLLKQAEQECLDLTNKLKRNIVALRERQQDVANLQSKVLQKEDMVAFLKGQYILDREKEAAELDKWANNTKELEYLLEKKEAAITGLTTRLDLFQIELSTRQTTFKEIENKMKEKAESFRSEISNLQNELAFQREQRDHCLEATLRMNKSMKEVKEPCLGLTTRITLFRKELEGREERVKTLEGQIQEKTEAALAELRPLREELQKQQEEKDKWNDSTLDIFWMLKERQDQTKGLTTRLELFMLELQKKEGAIEAGESRLKEIEKGLSQLENSKDEIKAQEEQCRKWEASTKEVSRLLQEKEEQRSVVYDKKVEQECISLSAKLDLFRGELQRRKDKVKELEGTYEHRGDMLQSEKAKLEKMTPILKADRDSWMDKTLKINQNLKDIQGQCVGLSTRWDLFKLELKKRKEAVEALESTVKERESYHMGVVEPYTKELQVQMDLRNKWIETTEKMNKLLRKKESECVNFTTQMESAIDELSSRKEQVYKLEAKLLDTRERSVYEMTNLRHKHDTAKADLENWSMSTKNIDKLLQDTRKECANLRVRLQVFHRQLETQNGRIATLEAGYNAKQEKVDAEVQALQNELHNQQAARDQSVSTTLDINQQIKAKELQCESISVRLSLFRAELENREKNVAALEETLKDKTEMSALKIDPLKARLLQQRKEVEKWAKNTQEVEQLLMQREEERVGLATRLKLFQLQVKTVDENVAALELRVQKREAEAAKEMAPFKNALETQKAERDRWTASTNEIQRLLHDRKTQIVGLTTRLSLFRREVRHREAIVSKLEAQLSEKQEEVDSFQLEPAKEELAQLREDRDKWASSTSNVVDLLNTRRREIDGLETRLTCFKIELQKREEACNDLQKQYNDKRDLYGSQVQVLKSELAMQVEQRDKWRDTTTEMKKQLDDKKAQCSGLTTRVELFQKEIDGHDVAIKNLEAKLKANDEAVGEVESLKNELKAQMEHCDNLNKSVLETDQMLKEKKDQCAGLATRLVVFRQQLKERVDRLAASETKIKEKEGLTCAQIESLQIDLQAQKEQRDKWSETTQELKQLLEEKENQCAIISAELELLTSLQGSL